MGDEERRTNSRLRNFKRRLAGSRLLRPVLSDPITFTEKLLIPLSLGLLAVYAHQGANRIAESQFRLAEIQAQQHNSQVDDDLQAKYVELFYSDITSGNSQKQSAALSLLRLMKPDLADKLARWVESNQQINLPTGLKSEVMGIRKDNAINLLNEYRIVIYYPGDDPDLTKAAQDIQDKLIQYGLNDRKLKLESRGRSFFEEHTAPIGFEIRYEPGYEEEAANVLRSVLTEVYPSVEFRTETVGSRTPNFISIFLGRGQCRLPVVLLLMAYGRAR